MTYQAAVGNLIEVTVELRDAVKASGFARVLNNYALGYQTMIRPYPPELMQDRLADVEIVALGLEVAAFSKVVNEYVKAFFAWDNRTRMDLNRGGFVYSFSKRFITSLAGVDIAGLKIYPTSPLVTRSHMREAVKLLGERKDQFDRTVWLNSILQTSGVQAGN